MMKVDMKRLKGPRWQDWLHTPAGRLAGCGALAALCLTVIGISAWNGQMGKKDSALAGSLYAESESNPGFTVQHMADVQMPYIQEGEGDVAVLSGGGAIRHIALDDGSFNMQAEHIKLYKDRKTDWEGTHTLAEASFLNGADGSQAEGWNLKEVWIGRDTDAENESDFTVLDVPQADGKADLSKAVLTNNPNHPGLSKTAGGRYEADGDGSYTICISDGDVIRLIFEPVESWESIPADVFDYDVTDGGYYLNGDYYRKGDLHATSGHRKEEAPVYLDATKNGIHSDENYTGDGARLAFGGTSIGTDFGSEPFNAFNTKGMAGANTGITAGLTDDGDLRWADGISAPGLFGDGDIKGRTAYMNGEYKLMFQKSGFTRTLTSVESVWGTAAEYLDDAASSFWILDVAPSYASDGHDPAWGSETRDVMYYRTGDRAPSKFPTSDDGSDHNSFFGLACVQDFTLSAGYTGPLDFFGYSDDDLWAYAARVDKDGNITGGTAVQMADLGGVHDAAASYCNLWDVINPIEYGGEDQQWRLFVYWLERDGSSAKCTMRFSLPQAAITGSRKTESVAIEAMDTEDGAGQSRTFVLDDGTHNRYKATVDGGSSFTITSGKEFTLPSGSVGTISDLDDGQEFTVKETGKARVWASPGDGYEEADTLSCMAGRDEQLYFVSAEKPGQITISVEADGTPEGGFCVHLTVDGMENKAALGMDAWGSPQGRLMFDENGSVSMLLSAGGSVSLYDMPEDAKFTLHADNPDGYSVKEIFIDDGLKASGRTVSGHLDAHASYKYKEDGTVAPKITMEQSTSGDWGTSGVTLKTGGLISYNVIVENPGRKAMDATAQCTVPDGLEVVESSLLDVQDLKDGVLSRPVSLKAGESIEMSFTCRAVAEKPCKIKTKTCVLMDGNTAAESNTVTAAVK